MYGNTHVIAAVSGHNSIVSIICYLYSYVKPSRPGVIVAKESEQINPRKGVGILAVFLDTEATGVTEVEEIRVLSGVDPLLIAAYNGVVRRQEKAPFDKTTCGRHSGCVFLSNSELRQITYFSSFTGQDIKL